MSGAPAAIEDMPQGTHERTPGGTLGDWLSGAAGRLQAAGIDSARLDARLLASFVLGWDPARVLAHPEHAPGGGKWSRLQSLLARRANREPLAVIIGKREFWSLDFAVTADTLVPRPESETLIEAALAVIGDRDADLNIIDLGTGSGCLLLALLSERPNARGLGVDLSAAALKVAAGNAAALGLEGRAEFRQSDWGRGLDGTEGRFDMILANPPYVADDEFAALEPEVSRFEPRLALSGGPDGLDCYRSLAPQIGPLLAPGGGAFIETGAAQAGAVSALFEENGLAVTSIHADLCGRPRVVEAQQV